MDSPRTYGGELAGKITGCQAEHADLWLEIRARHATHGEKIPLSLLEASNDRDTIAFRLPLWRPGRFELIAWNGDERSNAESIAIRPGDREARFEIRLTTNLGVIELYLHERANWRAIAAFACVLRGLSTPSTPVVAQEGLEIGRLTHPDSLGSIAESRFAPAGTLLLNNDGAIVISLSATRGKPVETIASVIAGMEIVTALCAVKSDANILGIERVVCAESLMRVREKE